MVTVVIDPRRCSATHANCSGRICPDFVAHVHVFPSTFPIFTRISLTVAYKLGLNGLTLDFKLLGSDILFAFAIILELYH